MKEDKNVSIEIGFGEALTLLFIALKLCNVINWSWALVLTPLWIGFGLAVIAVAIIVLTRL